MAIYIYETDLPIETRSEANTREHWGVKAKRAKTQRSDAHYWCRIKFGLLDIPETAKIHVRLVRLAPKQLDSDNLASAFKAIRDGIADYLKIDDGDARIDWEYAQEYMAKTRMAKVYLGIEC